jgi:hypothetical protein
MKTDLIETDNGNFILARNGQPLPCPFREIMVTEGPLGQPQIQKDACGSWCPHFNVPERSAGDGKLWVDLSCGNGREYKCDHLRAKKQEPLKRIIP